MFAPLRFAKCLCAVSLPGPTRYHVSMLEPVEANAPPGAHRAWSLALDNPAPGLLVTRVSGAVDVTAATHLWRYFERAFVDQPLVDTFHDWSGVTHYDSAVRTGYIEWSRVHRKRFRTVNILVKSRLVAMSVAVANLALGYLTAYTDVDEFSAARARAIEAHRRYSADHLR